MCFSISKTRLYKILLFALLSLGILSVGCAEAPTKGWCGATIFVDENNEGTIYVSSIEGKVIALNKADGTSANWEFAIEQKPTASLACSPQLSKPVSIYATPAVANGIVYIGDYEGNVYGIDIKTRMMNKSPTGGAIIGSPVIASDKLFIGSSDGKLYAFPLDLGEPRWIFPTGDKIWSTPAVDNGVVYFGSSDHKLYALDAEKGTEIWEEPFQAKAGILSTPLVYNNTIYIGACDFKFYAIHAATGKQKWFFEGADNWFWTQALAYNGEIWVGSLDHNLYVLDIRDGHEIKRFETQGAILTPPVLVDGMIIVGSEDGNLYIYDAEGKKEVRKIPLGAPILAPLYPDPQNGVVDVHAQDGEHLLYAIDVNTGEELWEEPYKTGE